MVLAMNNRVLMKPRGCWLELLNVGYNNNIFLISQRRIFIMRSSKCISTEDTLDFFFFFLRLVPGLYVWIGSCCKGYFSVSRGKLTLDLSKTTDVESTCIWLWMC